MMYEIIVPENLRFGSSKREREAGVLKNLTSATPRFKNLPFLVPENAVYLRSEGYNDEKNVRFKKYPNTCGRGLISKQ